MSTPVDVGSATRWRGNRRDLARGGVAVALAAAATPALARARQGATPAASPVRATPAASPAAGTAPYLLVADREAEAIYVYDIPGFQLTGQLDGVGFGIHGGSLLLEDGRLLFADTRNDEIVALTISATGVPTITQRAPADLGGNVAWISADPDLRYLAVGSLKEEGSRQSLNVVDLQRFENTVLEFEMAEPEEIHAWLLGDPLNLHVAVGGRIDSYLLAEATAGERTPLASVPVDLGSHGGATDAKNRRLIYTTEPGAGFDVLDAAAGPATYLTQIPWDLDGLTGGRNARPRLLHDGVHVFGVMTPGLDDPTTWAQATVSNHVANLDDLTAVRLPIAVGTIGYRWGLSADYALWAGYDVDGAKAYLLDADPAAQTFGTAVATIDLAMPTAAARPGEDPADAELYLMTAITPDSAYGFATISGDGLIQALDLAANQVVADIQVPSPLVGGGYSTIVQAGIAPIDLWAR